MTPDLFAPDPQAPPPAPERLGDAALLLRGFALARVDALWPALQAVLAQAPLRTMLTPGGRAMSAQLSNCGALGWVSDAHGYRYTPRDPQSQQPWPPLPDALRHLARDAAAAAGLGEFEPDAALINRYAPGARMSLHQDRDERDRRWPIVSLSLGLPAVFLWGGHTRADRVARVPLQHGDVVVWGGADRLRFHGVAPVPAGSHPVTGPARINCTLRRAG